MADFRRCYRRDYTAASENSKKDPGDEDVKKAVRRNRYAVQMRKMK
jgi:hypothetical protein